MGDEKRDSSARWKQVFVYIVAAAVSTVILVLFGNVDHSVIRDAARNLISMIGFLAAASIIMTSMYMGQVLREVPTMVGRLQPSFLQTIEQSIKKLDSARVVEIGQEMSLARNPVEFWEKFSLILVPVIKDAVRSWHRAFESFTWGPEAIRKEGWRSLYFLVASAFFSVLAILSGSSFFLAASLALIIASLWAIRQNWETAEATIKLMLWMQSLLTGPVGSTREAAKK